MVPLLWNEPGRHLREGNSHQREIIKWIGFAILVLILAGLIYVLLIEHVKAPKKRTVADEGAEQTSLNRGIRASSGCAQRSRKGGYSPSIGAKRRPSSGEKGQRGIVQQPCDKQVAPPTMAADTTVV